MTTASDQASAPADDFSDWGAGQVRSHAARLRVTQRELARRLGRPVAWINTRMVGQVSMSLRDLDAIADALGMAPMELLGGTPEPPRPVTPRQPRESRNTLSCSGGSRPVVVPFPQLTADLPSSVPA